MGEEGLAEQAVLSVAVESRLSKYFDDLWIGVRPWLMVSSQEFVTAVSEKIQVLDEENDHTYKSIPLTSHSER
ncbi:MAG: hypothetical protein ACI9CE_001830 [Flavobacterium sp.]